MSCHWSCDPRWVKISGHSEQLGPCGSTSHFVNNRHSKVKTQSASCIGGFGQTDGRRKFELRIPQSRGAAYIRGASYIRDKTVIISLRSIVYNLLFAWHKNGSNTPEIWGKEQRPANCPGTLWLGASEPTTPRRTVGPRSTPIKTPLPVPLWGPVEWCPITLGTFRHRTAGTFLSLHLGIILLVHNYS